LLRCLLRLLGQSKDIAYAYLFNSTLSPTEFLQYTVADFELPTSGKNKCELLLDLSRFLIARGAKQLTTVLIVDEAHQLSAETLEEIRMLSNIETANDKLLQIILVGQPELDEKLDSVELRQLKQRIALRAQLGALSAEETKAYIERRLRIAGADPAAPFLFSPNALIKVHRYSQGLPRLINTICENALVTAYARRTPSITAEVIEDVAREFRLDNSYSPEGRATNAHDKEENGPPVSIPLGRYAGIRSLAVSGADAPVAIQESRYEPNI
jgi:general secretion pathway protein A